MFEDQNAKRTELSELGEFGLISHITKNVKITHPETICGIGDDAAVIEPNGKQMLVTCDILAEGVHFDLTYSPLKHLGYKAAVVNISDIAAMNGTPKQLIVGISVSNRFSVEAIDELYAGILLACERYKVDLVGGDTTSSRSGLFISVTAVGEVEPGNVVYRSTAKENNLICVSGDLGGAYAGLLLLEREKKAFQANPDMQPELEGYDYALERQLKPEARMDIIRDLKAAGILPTSMIDISDGLASEILHICNDSKTGAVIYEEKLPIDTVVASIAEEFEIVPAVAALNGGEDYELLFTIDMKDYDKIQTIPGITIIGHITEEAAGVNLMSNSGSLITIQAQGWNHYSKNDI
jgi:thiamine-monophosphate kinase